MRSALSHRLLLASLSLLVLMLIVPASQPPGLDAGGVGFAIRLEGTAVMGGAEVAIDLAGNLLERGGAACQGGELAAGTLRVSDGKERFTGAVTEGFATLGCTPGFPRGLVVRATGFMDDPAFTPFQLLAMGGARPNGDLVAVRGLVLSFPEFFGPKGVLASPGKPPEPKRPPPRAEASQLFGGLFTGEGKLEGLIPASGEWRGGDLEPEWEDWLLVPPSPPQRGRPDGAVGVYAIDVEGETVMGDAAVEVSLAGRLFAGGGECAGPISGGRLTIKDEDDTYIARFEEGAGFASASSCEPLRGRTLTFDAFGLMSDAASTPVSLFGTATLGHDGRLTEVSGHIFTIPGVPANLSSHDVVAFLRSRVDLFAGRYAGSGSTDGFVGVAPAPGVATFELRLRGQAGAERFVLEVQGVVPSPLGPHIEVTAARLRSGDTTYSVRFLRFLVARPSAAELVLVMTGTLQTDGANEGAIIGALELEDAGLRLFTAGGRVDLRGRLALLRLGGRRFTPEVRGTFVVEKE